MSAEQENQKELFSVINTANAIDSKTYEVDDKYRWPENLTFESVHTMSELHAFLESDAGKDTEVDALVLATNPDEGTFGACRLNRAKFMESWKSNSRKRNVKKILEGFNGGGGWQTGANLIGNDYTPLLGGPFFKQLYLHDMLRMFSLAFYAWNHDPIAKALINITVDFTLGRGYRVDSKNKAALALWRAFEKVNNLPELMRHMAIGLSRDGEVMPWFMPDGQLYNEWDLPPEQVPAPVLIPRVKLMDPSACWEVITYPEDIDRVVAYQFVYPTQYNIYQAEDEGAPVRSAKFIMRQIPAAQIDHIRINRDVNEKRGRSDLYSIFGYLKRLRDTVEYSIVGMAKAAAWAIDTEVDGSITDIQGYLQDQQSQKSIPPAGSEFIHSKKIKRQYLGNDSTKNGGSVSAFEWCLNMICAGRQIPVSYLGTHLSGGQTKASALVGTEPVTKMFEARQDVYVQIVRKFWDRLMEIGGLEADCEITFPELISQDRTAKIKDTITAQEVGAVSHEYMATTIAQELGFTSYDYQTEMGKIAKEKAAKIGAAADDLLIAPLTAKPPATPAPSGSSGISNPTPSPSPISKTARAATAASDRKI